ncbi:Shwachman-Bodian-diamond syndrome protein [Xylona heveae TC161]|uniref:Ribosome maturation protein SDO1 n=1 Tax=Xylona heveae (strain CBS 132557 / TC161) TaxID=1328760 RepID=A0A165HY91_XYLHT|nr:Shwachman-Bodian-diamond syndrome protein [Xylona heveae TC161]KZF24093.1 Shwachman-Bodian-diamond syndrome protein [Xylona heveae TC161]
MPINQPSNQIKLTNVSLVRMKKGKKRYEIACYKNKVLEWRSGVEKDLDNVLQIPTVFLSVSKGQAAPAQDLQKSFPKLTTDEIILEILNKGELQVGEKERHAQLERLHNEVINIIAGKLIDPKSKLPYTPGMIDKALDQLSAQAAHAQQDAKAAASGNATPGGSGEEDVTTPKPKSKDMPTWTGVVTTKSAKSQALDAMKALIAHQTIPVQRARMRIRVTCSTSILKQMVKAAPKSTEDGEEKAKGTVKDRILGFIEQIETQDALGDEWEAVGFVDPGAFKGLEQFIGSETRGQGRVEVLDMAVVKED